MYRSKSKLTNELIDKEVSLYNLIDQYINKNKQKIETKCKKIKCK